MEESLVQILSPKRRIDVLRDALSAREHGRPYVVTFCGVNGVGKSTNLAKVRQMNVLHSYMVFCMSSCSLYGVRFTCARELL